MRSEEATEEFKTILRQSVVDQAFVRAVFSRPASGTSEIRRIDVRPVNLKGETVLQIAERTRTQEFHRNLPDKEAIEAMLQFTAGSFRDIWLRTTAAEWQLRLSRRGDASLKRKSNDRTLTSEPTPHDQKPDYLIPDGEPCGFLQLAGVMDQAGRVRSRSYHKFRQINHYLNLIRSSLESLPDTGPINVVDFGCGKSYLTFATHHLLSNILGRDCRVTGLDVREDVVRTCRKNKEQLSIDSINFEVGRIETYEPSEDVHLAISLHACNTATDDAICSAVQWKVPVILAVPCCQHELAQHESDAVSQIPLIRGVLTDRFAATATDAMRAGVLRAVGYKADVIEFIETDHTPKNLMIRAVRRQSGPVPDAESAARNELLRFRELWQLPALRLERLLLNTGHLSE